MSPNSKSWLFSPGLLVSAMFLSVHCFRALLIGDSNTYRVSGDTAKIMIPLQKVIQLGIISGNYRLSHVFVLGLDKKRKNSHRRRPFRNLIQFIFIGFAIKFIGVFLSLKPVASSANIIFAELGSGRLIGIGTGTVPPPTKPPRQIPKPEL